MVSLDDLNKAIDGKIAIYRMGRALDLRLKKGERCLYDKAVEQGYVVRNKKRVGEAYWFYCDSTNIPCVRVELHKVYATVQCDMITASDHLLDDKALHEMYIAAKKSGWPAAGYKGDKGSVAPSWTLLNGVPVSHAEYLAKTFWEIARNQDSWISRYASKNSGVT